MDPVGPLDTRIYRAALRLCPPAFGREFGPQMLRDFDEARGDADPAGHPTPLWRFHARMALDLARTLARQWIKTGMPVIVLLAVAATSITIALVGQVARRLQFTLPDTGSNLELLGLLFFTTVLVMLIMLAIMFTQWAAHPRVRRRHRIGRR